MEQKYYICKHCGNIVLKAKDSGVPVVCCGEPMTELIAGTSDGAREKHVPVWSVENGIVHVQVGSVEHPMLPEHHIDFICVETTDGYIIAHPGERPEATFAVSAGKAVALWEYCNLHGLWKATISE